MDDMTLRAQRDATETLIAESPFSIALRRQTTERTPSGGVRNKGWMNHAERIRFFGAATGEPRVINTTEGERVEVRNVLVGRYDDDIQDRDEFTIGARKFRVVYVDPSTRAYETRAVVVEYA